MTRRKKSTSTSDNIPEQQQPSCSQSTGSDPLAEILAKAISENSDLRLQLLSKLDLSENNGACSSATDPSSVQQKNPRKRSARQAMRINDNIETGDSNPLPATKKRKATNRTVAARTDQETPQVDSGSESEPDLESTCTVGNSLDVNSVLNSSDDSDSESSEHNELDDLGLLSELLNDEVKDEDKKKIWQRQFIDLNKLYYGNDGNQVQMSVTKTKDSSVTHVSKPPQKKINNILSWSRAFQLYASIYCIKYPNEAAGMFQYMTLIQTLAQKSQNWQLYDIKFRKLRRHKPLPLAKLHLQTHIYASLTPPPKSTMQRAAGTFRPNSNSFRPNGQSSSKIFRNGYCWEFQRFGRCSKSSCSRAHKCSLCEGTHAGASCPRGSRPFPSPTGANFKQKESSIHNTNSR